MITCKFLSGKTCVLPVIEGETVREYCIRLMDATNVQPYKETCYYILINDGKLVNRLDNRHKLLKDCMISDKPICAVFSTLQPPSQQALVKGNMRADGFEPDLKTCAICMEDFTGNTIVVRGTFIALDCGHRFHMTCVARDPSGLCPTCRTPIDGSHLYIIRMYSRACATD